MVFKQSLYKINRKILSQSFNLIFLQKVYQKLNRFFAFLLLIMVFRLENKIMELILLFFTINFKLFNFTSFIDITLLFCYYLCLNFLEIFDFSFNCPKYSLFYAIHSIYCLSIILNLFLCLNLTLSFYQFSQLVIMESFIFVIHYLISIKH